MHTTIDREAQISTWLTKQGHPNPQLTLLAGDASFRRYFRLFTPNATYIVMDAPVETNGSSQPFVSIADAYAAEGVPVPVVLAQDIEQGFLLLTDFGDNLLQDVLNDLVNGSRIMTLNNSNSEQQHDSDHLVRDDSNLAFDANSATQHIQNTDLIKKGNNTCQSKITAYYQQALGYLPKISNCKNHLLDYTLPCFNRKKIISELKVFKTWYLECHREINLSKDENNSLENLFENIADKLLEQPYIIMHRDYHSRNLMVINKPGHPTTNNPYPELTNQKYASKKSNMLCARKSKEDSITASLKDHITDRGINSTLGVIDFQDTMMGPITYDPASLLRDCYIDWPEEWVLNQLEEYRVQLHDLGLLENTAQQTFENWFNWSGLQRHLKALGTFARKFHRDEDDSYLNDIPRTLDYIKDEVKACEITGDALSVLRVIFTL